MTDTSQSVKLTEYFFNKLNQTNLFSSMLFFLTKKAKKGRANKMIKMQTFSRQKNINENNQTMEAHGNIGDFKNLVITKNPLPERNFDMGVGISNDKKPEKSEAYLFEKSEKTGNGEMKN